MKEPEREQWDIFRSRQVKKGLGVSMNRPGGIETDPALRARAAGAFEDHRQKGLLKCKGCQQPISDRNYLLVQTAAPGIDLLVSAIHDRPECRRKFEERMNRGTNHFIKPVATGDDVQITVGELPTEHGSLPAVVLRWADPKVAEENYRDFEAEAGPDNPTPEESGRYAPLHRAFLQGMMGVLAGECEVRKSSQVMVAVEKDGEKLLLKVRSGRYGGWQASVEYDSEYTPFWQAVERLGLCYLAFGPGRDAAGGLYGTIYYTTTFIRTAHARG